MNIAIHPGLEALQDGFLMVDPEWRVTYWNAAAERFLSISRDAVLGRVLWDAVPELAAPAREHLHAALSDGRPHEFLLPHPSGDGRHFAMRAAPLEHGGMAVHFRDATGETELAERYVRLLESIRDGFVAVDSNWTIIHINGAAERLLLLPRERALGAPIEPLLAGQPAQLADSLRATMRDGAPRHLPEVRPEGRVFEGRSFDLWISPLPGGGASILFEDVTQHLQREKDLARLAAEAEDANRAKARFFAAVSHELRTPLNAVMGYMHLLRTETYGPMPAGAQRAADRATVCAEHLVRLIDDVLLLTTTEIGRIPVVPVPVSLEHLLPEITRPMRQQAEAKGLRFELRIPNNIPVVQTDPDRLRQLLLALLSNAVKFTGRGEVRVEAAACTVEGASRGDGGSGWPSGTPPCVEITVADSGPGIASENRERIFAPFEQLGDPSRSDSMKHGTGLGLTIARRLAELLGGDLRVESAEGGGAALRLRLPLAAAVRRA